jgi:hypothetical protein
MEVRTKEISDWLRTLTGHDNEGRAIQFAPKTRNHYRNAVMQLFNHARDYGYLPKGMPTEADVPTTGDMQGTAGLVSFGQLNELFSV